MEKSNNTKNTINTGLKTAPIEGNDDIQIIKNPDIKNYKKEERQEEVSSNKELIQYTISTETDIPHLIITPQDLAKELNNTFTTYSLGLLTTDVSKLAQQFIDLVTTITTAHEKDKQYTVDAYINTDFYQSASNSHLILNPDVNEFNLDNLTSALGVTVALASLCSSVKNLENESANINENDEDYSEMDHTLSTYEIVTEICKQYSKLLDSEDKISVNAKKSINEVVTQIIELETQASSQDLSKLLFTLIAFIILGIGLMAH